jgi:hypothetical protein
MKVKDFLTGPEKWTKGAYARRQDGASVNQKDPYAVSWCIYGLLCHCYGDTDNLDFVEAYQKVWRRVGPMTVWNDAAERTFEEVRAVSLELDI